MQIIEALDADCIDESEVLTCADELHHIDKRAFSIPFVCGAKDLGEAMRRIGEGAAMIRLKGNAGTGNVLHAVRHARKVVLSAPKQLYSFTVEIEDHFTFKGVLRDPSPPELARGRALRFRQGTPG